MNYNRILLINPPYSRSRVRVVFSAGLGYIAEVLEDLGFEYDVLDMSLGYTYNSLARKIDNFHPDLIGISMMTYRYKETRRTMRRNWTRRLARLGPLGKALAFIYSCKFTQDVILRNKFCRVLLYELARKVVSY
jgi:hypothetical protein